MGIAKPANYVDGYLEISNAAIYEDWEELQGLPGTVKKIMRLIGHPPFDALYQISLGDIDIHYAVSEKYDISDLIPYFETRGDAQTWYQNSGIYNWDWGRHKDDITDDDVVGALWNANEGELVDDVIADLIIQHGGNPKDYF